MVVWYVCKLCGFRTQDELELWEHLEKEHGINDFQKYEDVEVV